MSEKIVTVQHLNLDTAVKPRYDEELSPRDLIAGPRKRLYRSCLTGCLEYAEQLQKTLVLASTSPARKMLLERLRYPFCLANPDIDETPFLDETGEALVKRLALAKADAVKHQYPDALVIGADQIALLDAIILGKPLNYENALAYLQKSSGKKVTFFCGLCLLDTATGKTWLEVEPYTVFFRTLSDATIAAYLHKEQPFGCAGGFKSEGLGITLVEKFHGTDPTSLIGLPLIHLTSMLAEAGINLP